MHAQEYYSPLPQGSTNSSPDSLATTSSPSSPVVAEHAGEIPCEKSMQSTVSGSEDAFSVNGGCQILEKSRLYSSRKASSSPLVLTTLSNTATTTATANNTLGTFFSDHPAATQQGQGQGILGINSNGNAKREHRSEPVVKSALMSMLLQVLSAHSTIFDVQDITRILYSYRCLVTHLSQPPPKDIVTNAIAFYSSRFPLPTNASSIGNNSNFGGGESQTQAFSSPLRETGNRLAGGTVGGLGSGDTTTTSANPAQVAASASASASASAFASTDHNVSIHVDEDNDKSDTISDEFSDWDDEDDELELSTMSNDRGSVLPSVQSQADQVFALHAEMRHLLDS
jgi:hypothetical protein